MVRRFGSQLIKIQHSVVSEIPLVRCGMDRNRRKNSFVSFILWFVWVAKYFAGFQFEMKIAILREQFGDQSVAKSFMGYFPSRNWRFRRHRNRRHAHANGRSHLSTSVSQSCIFGLRLSDFEHPTRFLRMNLRCDGTREDIGTRTVWLSMEDMKLQGSSKISTAMLS